MLLAVAAVLTTTWALILPPWQAPDETAHFGYVQELAEDLDLPGDGSPQRTFSTEQDLAAAASNVQAQVLNPPIKSEWDPAVAEAWRTAQGGLDRAQRSDGGRGNSAASNPPTYYTYASAAYLAARDDDVITRLYLVRIWTGLLLLVAVAATWLLAGEIFGLNRLLQTTAAAVVALQPMTTFVSGVTGVDALLIAVWSVATWLGVRVLRRGLDLRSGVALALVCALAILTKATGYVLVPGFLLVLGISLLRSGSERRRTLAVAWICVAVLAVPVVAWVGTSVALDRTVVNRIPTTGAMSADRPVNPRQFVSYLWEFYLPRLPFMRPVAGAQKDAFNVFWIQGFWGAYGWKEVVLPPDVSTALKWLTLIVLAGGLAFAVREAFIRQRLDPAVPLFLAVVALTLIALLHYVDYRSVINGKGPFMQGRYLLPLVGTFGCLLAGAVALIPVRARPPAAGAALAGLCVLQVLALDSTIARFYA